MKVDCSGCIIQIEAVYTIPLRTLRSATVEMALYFSHCSFSHIHSEQHFCLLFIYNPPIHLILVKLVLSS